MKPKIFLLATILICCIVATLSAQTTEAPRKINFQGKLNNPTQGPVNLTFAIYKTATGGAALWSETQNSVTVLNGIVNVLLGNVTPIPNAVLKDGGDLFLEIRVGNTSLSKRVQIASVAYAIKATFADTARYAITAGGNSGGNRNSLDAADGDPKDVVFVDNAGNVGIGTSFPSAKLHIAGTVGIDGILFPDGTLQTTASLALPYSKLGSDNNTLFSITSTGLGQVGSFVINNPSNNSSALYARTNGQDNAVYGLSTGSGDAGSFEINNPNSESAGVLAITDGLGDAGYFEISNPTNQSSALYARTDGEGNAVYGFTVGKGTAGYFQIDNAGNSSAAIYAETSGVGHAGEFQGSVHISGNTGIGITDPTEKLFVDGNIRATGSITPGSSREFKENISSLSLEEALTILASLDPVKFQYKADEKKDLHVGFIAEEVPDLLATPDRKGVDPMDVIGILTKVVQDQQAELVVLRKEVNALKQQQN